MVLKIEICPNERVNGESITTLAMHFFQEYEEVEIGNLRNNRGGDYHLYENNMLRHIIERKTVT